MGKKYIIEMKEGERLYKTKLNALNEPVIREITCEPYTEPDTEAAYAHGYSNAEIKYRAEVKEAYQKGLSDAWDAARKIASDNAGQNYSIFGQHFTVEILNTHSASEAIEKIRQYEQEKEAFHVGDEFANGNGDKFVIIKMDGKEIDRYIDKYGTTYAMNVKYSEMRKTGRHFPEIATVLQKMKGGFE